MIIWVNLDLNVLKLYGTLNVNGVMHFTSKHRSHIDISLRVRSTVGATTLQPPVAEAIIQGRMMSLIYKFYVL